MSKATREFPALRFDPAPGDTGAVSAAASGRLAGQTAPAGSPEFARLKDRYDTARSHANSVSSQLQDVIAQARRPLDEHRSAASAAAGRINGVANAPYKEPGWLSRAWSSVTSWISEHADVLAEISTVLKGVSAVLGVLSLVPGLQFLAPFAVAAGRSRWASTWRSSWPPGRDPGRRSVWTRR